MFKKSLTILVHDRPLKSLKNIRNPTYDTFSNFSKHRILTIRFPMYTFALERRNLLLVSLMDTHEGLEKK
ncbi:MAG: hypothetical protein NPIRA02_27590 [Nitrospirales bacterium]|nr:MAG: hypothetical protein NPIRA02_27590 [Nitrospirales bacterium]